MKKNFLIFVFPFFISLFFSNFVLAQKSASLFLSPASGTYQVGQTFNINVVVRSEDQTTNAAEGTIKFDPTIIRVRSISKSGSIFEYWPEDPVKTFSNSAGTIRFVGGAPTPYRGSSGRIFTITFEALREGTASVNFLDGRVIAADGFGTDITDRLIGGSYNLVLGAVPPSPPPTPSPGLPSAPKISSPTHPDPEKWYSNKNPKVVWEVPSGILAVRTLLGKIPTAQPTVVYEPPISSKEFENLEDGVWYFSAQFKNERGWGEIGRFKIQIDTTPPKDFLVSVDNEGDPRNPTPLFKFETTDETSGIDYYEVILNRETFAKVKPEEIREGAWRVTSPLEPKNYTLEVKAFDKAGNFTLGKNYLDQTLTTVSFSIEPIPLEIFPFQKRIKAGTPLKIEGKTVPDANLKLYIQKGEEISIREKRADSGGNFKFEEILPIGKYIVWIQSQDRKGGTAFSQKYEVEIVKERLVLFLSIIFAILILIGLIIIILLLRKIKKEREKIKAEKIKKIKEEKLKAYLILKEKVEEQIKYLESKVDLSRGETRVLENLKKALKEAEEERSKTKEIEEKT